MSQHPFNIYPGSWPLIAESRILPSVQPEVMDELWSVGWRHFGPDFFRASLMAEETALKRQIPLRIAVPEFRMSKGQRRTYRKNQDLTLSMKPAVPGAEEERLFQMHKQRFQRNVPDELRDFLGDRPHGSPCPCLQLSVLLDGVLIAASFLALGRRSCSSIYAVFDPDHSKRRLGVFTMLAELEYAKAHGLDYFYSGYATIESSCYDYKKEFNALRYYDWEGNWVSLDEL